VTSPRSEHLASRRHPSHPILRCVVLAACIAATAGGSALAIPQPRTLEYRVAWNGIPAANATVEITPARIDGHEHLIVQAMAGTNRFVDLFWKFRGTVRSTLRADDLTPVDFVYDRRMAGKPYRTRVDFDRRSARSVYVRGSHRQESSVDAPDLIDPITAVFRARASGARPGDTLSYDVWTGESRYRVVLAIGQPEPIEVPAGRFRALRIVPEVWKVGAAPALDTRLRTATIWVSDDPSHTLLRIRSDIFIGAVTLDLVSASRAA
jgi:hypothetical protein